MDEPRTPPPRPRWRRPLLWGAAAVAFVLVFAAGGFIVLVVSLFSGTALTRDDFPTAAEASNFVSDHLPVPLPANATIQELKYERFTDWHLEAAVDLGSEAATDAYLLRALEQREEDVDYCGPSASGPRAVNYFLSKWHACGSVTATEQGGLAVRCFTR